MFLNFFNSYFSKNFFKKLIEKRLTAFIVFILLSFSALLYFIIPALFNYVLPSVISFISDTNYFLSLLFSNYNSNNISFDNFKFDVDITTNTDGEDFLSYINDLVEISLQERAYFFDWILSNPFEFMLFTSFSYIFYQIILKKKIKTSGNIFKYMK